MGSGRLFKKLPPRHLSQNFTQRLVPRRRTIFTRRLAVTSLQNLPAIGAIFQLPCRLNDPFPRMGTVSLKPQFVDIPLYAPRASQLPHQARRQQARQDVGLAAIIPSVTVRYWIILQGFFEAEENADGALGAADCVLDLAGPLALFVFRRPSTFQHFPEYPWAHYWAGNALYTADMPTPQIGGAESGVPTSGSDRWRNDLLFHHSLCLRGLGGR